MLRIHIPSNWPGQGSDARLSWVRLGAKGERLDSGRSVLDELPADKVSEIVLPAAIAVLLSIPLPEGLKQKRGRMLAYAIEDRLGAEPETVHVVAGPLQPDGRTVVGVIEKSWLRRVLDRLKTAGIKPRSAWPETLLPALPPDGWVLVWNGQEGFLRTEAHAGMPVDGGSEVEPPVALKLAAQALQNGAEARKTLQVRPANAAMQPNTAAWAAALGMPVGIGLPWDPIRSPEPYRGGVEFLQGEFTPAALMEMDWKAFRLPLALLGALLLVQLGATLVEWGVMAREESKLSAQMERRFREVFPEAVAVVDAPLQMQRKLDDLRHALRQPGANDLLPLLSRAMKALDDDQRSGLRRISYDAARLGIECGVRDRAAAEALLAAFRQAGLQASLESVDMKNSGITASYVING